MSGKVRPYADPSKPGRRDAQGEWWACDPYPTWYRWEGKKLIKRDSWRTWPKESK